MENTVPFSSRVTVSAGAAETIVQVLAAAGLPNRSPTLMYVRLEPDAANITSIEVGFIDAVTGAFMPRCETTSALGRVEYSGMMQTGPRGADVGVRMVTGAAAATRVLFDGVMVDG